MADEAEPVEVVMLEADTELRQDESDHEKVEDSGDLIPVKRKASEEKEGSVPREEDVDEVTTPMAREETTEVKEDVGEDAVQYASVIAPQSQPTISAAPPPKKKAKSKAGAKGAKATIKNAASDRGSVATEDTGTPDIETPMETKKGPKKKAAATKGKKRKASTQISAASTPAPDREETPQDHEEHEDVEMGEDGEDKTKLYCICQTLYDNEKMMVACDRCDDWFHTACMGMDEEKADFIDFFYCPHCEPFTTYRTSWRRKCARVDCEKAVVPPITRYCCDECGILVAMSKLGKVKQLKGMAPQDIAEKLASPQVIVAIKIDGVAVWDEGQSRNRWLKEVLQKGETNISVAKMRFIEEVNREKAIELPEMEMLSRLESRLAEVQHLKANVNRILDSIAARTKLLHLAEERAPLLEPLLEDGDIGASNGKKGSSKAKKSKADEIPTGQLRCGYDERLGWDEARFQAWSQTQKARDIIDQKTDLDGTLVIDDDVPVDEVGICGRSSRKCKRHGDWMTIRSADLDADQTWQTNQLSSLDDEEKELSRRIEQIQTIIKDVVINEEEKRKERDAALARQLANEGTRRAITSM